MENLSGAELDTLYKLVNYGPQDDGGLPSKSGMCGLIHKGLAEKDYDKALPNSVTEQGLKEYPAHFKV